jgi:hypothetical protein
MCMAKEAGTQSQTRRKRQGGLGLWRRDKDGKEGGLTNKKRGGKKEKKKEKENRREEHSVQSVSTLSLSLAVKSITSDAT